ncbi:MAG: hypothetical protein J0I41_19580 [Filimonas sp.]|nr:hypothetical protein [Filimonas sp.]
METPVIIAIITAAGSAVVAVISLISARNASKMNGKTSLQLETLKFELEQKRTVNAYKFALTEKQIISVDKFISRIQELKDVLHHAIVTGIDMHSSKIFIGHVKACSDDIAAIYSKESTNLNKQLVRCTHDVKGLVFELNMYVEKVVQGKYVNLDDQQKEYFLSARSKLTELQQLLRDERYKLDENNIG